MKKSIILLFFFVSMVFADKKIEIRGIQDAQKTKEIEAKLSKVQEEHDLFGLTELLRKYRLKPNRNLSSESVMVYEVQAYSALYDAVIDDDVSKVREILQNPDVDVDSVYHDKYTALITASYHGQDEIVKMLLEYGADVDKIVGEYHKNALYHAIWEQHLSIVKLLVESGADLESFTGIASSTPLMHAARRKSVDIVKYLLDKGANPNATTKDGYTSLMYALLEPPMKRGNEEIVSLLIEKSDLNYKPKIVSKLGVPQTALLMAILMNHSQKIIDKMFEHGAKIGDSAKEKVAFLKAYQQKFVMLYKQDRIKEYQEAAIKSISYVGYSADKEVQVELAIALSALYELSIIEGWKIEKKYQKLFKKLALENIKVAVYHDMFRIIKDALKSDQSEALKIWQKKYKKSVPINWSFKELKEWAKSLDKGAKKRVLLTIKVFEVKEYRKKI